MIRSALVLGLAIASIATPCPAQDAGTLLWKHAVGAPIWSQPASSEGLLYFGCDDGVVRAFDPATRSNRWEFGTQGRVRSAVTVHEGHALFASDDGGLYAVEAESGRREWRFDLGSAAIARRLPALTAPYTYDYAHSSPIVHDGVVYVGSADHHVYAIDLESGGLIWKFETGGMVRATAVVDRGAVFVGSWDGTLYALETETGAVRWKFASGGPIPGGAAIGGGTVVFGNRGARIFALDVETGEPAWEFVHENGSWVESTPVIAQDTVYVGSSDALALYALDLASGDERWIFETGGWSWAKPAVIGEVVYVGAISASPYYVPGVTLEPAMHAVDRTSGARRWTLTPDTMEGYVTGGFFAGPVIVDGVVFVAGIDGQIHAVKGE